MNEFVSSSFFYVWNNGVIIQDLFDVDVGIYFVIISGLGCEKEYIYIVLVININFDVIIEFVCVGNVIGSIFLIVFGNYLELLFYEWLGGVIILFIGNLSVGEYCVIVMDVNFC